MRRPSWTAPSSNSSTPYSMNRSITSVKHAVTTMQAPAPHFSTRAQQRAQHDWGGGGWLWCEARRFQRKARCAKAAGSTGAAAGAAARHARDSTLPRRALAEATLPRRAPAEATLPRRAPAEATLPRGSAARLSPDFSPNTLRRRLDLKLVVGLVVVAAAAGVTAALALGGGGHCCGLARLRSAASELATAADGFALRRTARGVRQCAVLRKSWRGVLMHEESTPAQLSTVCAGDATSDCDGPLQLDLKLMSDAYSQDTSWRRPRTPP